MKRILILVSIAVVGLVVIGTFPRNQSRAALGQQEHFNLVHHVSSSPGLDVWRINNPDVQHPTTFVKQIRFKPGDKISIEAGGCVQTGGKGKTWKRYVDPIAPDATELYHGLVGIPRPEINRFTQSSRVPGLVRIKDVIGKSWTIVDSKDEHEGDYGFSYLVLGYEDGEGNYQDNGYRDPDDGTEDQCQGAGNAWVKVTIEHHP